MGKDLKGKACGKGISQRKDGLYVARIMNSSGKRIGHTFTTLQEARNWIEDRRYEKKHKRFEVDSDITVDKWFEYWLEHIEGDLAANTKRNYRERYVHNIQPVIGGMLLSKVKQMHCKEVLNRMESKYRVSTIIQVYITMGTMLKSALQNDFIQKHPMDGVKYTKPIRVVEDTKFLAVDEERKFMEVAKRSHNKMQYELVLETGLRTGELVGLTWDAINFEKRTLTVNKTLEYRYSTKCWSAGPPKTRSSYRTIPLSDRAYEILKTIHDGIETRKESPKLATTLEYMDRRTGEKANFTLRDLVFINWRTGEPAKNSSYDTHLYKLCDEAGIKRFCMHVLRHTYATRAIENNMQPKVLQKLLGHASIKTTMDRYVHVTDDSLLNAVQQLEISRKKQIGSKMVQQAIL